MDLIEAVRKAWEKHFENLILEHPNEFVVRVLSENRKRFDMGDCTLADIGCATGSYTVTAIKMRDKVVAVDFVSHYLQITKKRVDSLDGHPQVTYI